MVSHIAIYATRIQRLRILGFAQLLAYGKSVGGISEGEYCGEAGHKLAGEVVDADGGVVDPDAVST